MHPDCSDSRARPRRISCFRYFPLCNSRHLGSIAPREYRWVMQDDSSNHIHPLAALGTKVLLLKMDFLWAAKWKLPKNWLICSGKRSWFFAHMCVRMVIGGAGSGARAILLLPFLSLSFETSAKTWKEHVLRLSLPLSPVGLCFTVILINGLAAFHRLVHWVLIRALPAESYLASREHFVTLNMLLFYHVQIDLLWQVNSIRVATKQSVAL